MTLPNRPGYRVLDNKRSVHLPPSPTNSSADLLKHLPFPPHAQTDPQVASLFPFLGTQTDVMKIVEKGLGYGMEGGVPSHVTNVDMAATLGNSRLAELAFKQQHVEGLGLSMDELASRKSYVRSHRLLPSAVEMLAQSKKEGIIPPIEPVSLYGDAPQPGTIDFGLDDFLQAQEIDTNPNLPYEDAQKNDERNEFLYKLEQLREKYKEELDKLNRVCNEFCTRMLTLLRDQSTTRPVHEQEIQLKINGIQQKFDYVRNQLRQNVCNAILVLQKQYHQSPKKRRSLPKKATEHLSNWFFDHLNDPYPADEEKSLLAASGGLTMSQVNNWFGNKRYTSLGFS